VTAALLHDVVDDTDVRLEAVAAEFGARVAGIVAQVSQLSNTNQLLRRQRRKLVRAPCAPRLAGRRGLGAAARRASAPAGGGPGPPSRGQPRAALFPLHRRAPDRSRHRAVTATPAARPAPCEHRCGGGAAERDPGRRAAGAGGGGRGVPAHHDPDHGARAAGHRREARGPAAQHAHGARARQASLRPLSILGNLFDPAFSGQSRGSLLAQQRPTPPLTARLARLALQRPSAARLVQPWQPACGRVGRRGHERAAARRAGVRAAAIEVTLGLGLG